MKIYDIHKRNNASSKHIALYCKGQKVSYDELENNIEQYARYFSCLGLKYLERVAIALPSSPEFIYAYLGIARAGGVAVPLNLLQAPMELVFILRDCGARYLITNQEINHKLKNLPGLPLSLVVLDEKCKQDILAARPVTFPHIDEQNVCTLLYTSGTTGNPKAAMLTHANLIGNVISMDDASDFGREDNFLAVLPMFHSFGWTVCVLFPLYLGCSITILDGFRPKEVLQTLIEKGITVFCGVPSMFYVLLKLHRQATFPKLKFAISGGDSISKDHMIAFEKSFNFPIIEGYGLSEASPVVCLNPLYGKRKIKSIGIALPGIDVKVFDERDKELAAGEVGELVVKGPNVMKGYHNREADTREVLREGWLHSGDLAYMDEEGYFFIVGRKKELIITAGFNVYPREVEEALIKHPSVADAAVIGVPHSTKGEEIKAYIIPEEAHSPGKKELVRFLKGSIAGYKIPEIFTITNDLPRGPNGKILKRLLK